MPIPGGCAYNTSIAIGNLFKNTNFQVGFLGRISNNFFGDIQVQKLREYNVKENFLIRGEENPILAIIKTEEGKEPQYAFYHEGAIDRLLSHNELNSVLEKNSDIDISCVVFGSVCMTMEPIASTIESFITVKSAEKKVIAFDPNIRPFFIKDREAFLTRFKKWAGLCTIAKISGEDFEFIFPDAKPETALEKMIDLGTRLAIVTLGSSGTAALLRRGDNTVIKTSVPGVKIPNTGDTVGAGDTFLGAFLAHLELRGKLSPNMIVNLSETELRDALSFANKAAAIVCTRYGAQPPALGEIED